MRKHLVLIAFLSVLFVSITGCADKTKRIEGEVIKISGTLPQLVQSSGALFSNESIMIGTPSLVYMVKVGEDIYTLSIIEGNRVSRVTLVPRVCLGTKISFSVREIAAKSSEGFDPNHLVGSNYSDDIGVMKPCLQ